MRKHRPGNLFHRKFTLLSKVPGKSTQSEKEAEETLKKKKKKAYMYRQEERGP